MKRKLKITIKDDHNHYALIEQVNNRENEINRGIFLDKDQYEQLRQHFVSGECEHPYHSVLGDGEMQPAKCLKCGKVL